MTDTQSLRHSSGAEAQTTFGRHSNAVSAAIVAMFSDTAGRVSRPKFLFAVAGFDIVLVVASAAVANWAQGGTGDHGGSAGLLAVAMAVILVGLLRRNWSYSISALQDVTGQIGKIGHACLLAFVSLAGAAHLFALPDIAPGLLVTWAFTTLAALASSRVVAANLIDRLAEARALSRRTVIVGSGGEADALRAALQRTTGAHVEILGYFDDRSAERSEPIGTSIERLGSFNKLAEYCQANGVDLVIVAVPLSADRRLLEILQELFAIRVDIRISAHNARLQLNPSAYKYIGDVPMLAVMDRPLSDWDRGIKNAFDRVMAIFILVAVSPIMLATAIAIRLDSKGPVLFKQRRYGFDNELVEIWKFRSMYADQSDAHAAKLVTKGDPRVTRVGRFIRKTSLDELPQLFNVLTGEMSLVGPRPHATQAKAGDSLYQEVVQGYLARHRVKPGITGWAQVCGWRGETDTHEKILRRVECDLYYIENWSLRFDLYVITLTPFVLATGKNAY